MGSSILPELGFDCRFSSKARVQKPISRFFANASKTHSVPEKVLKLDDYVNRLQDEMKKIDAFKRELPLCMLLLTDAIEIAQEELSMCKKLINSKPVLEEFIPLKKICTDEKDDKDKVGKEKDNNSRDKMNWMSSVQLWNSDNDDNDPNTDFSSNKLNIKIDNDKKGKEEGINRAVMDDLFESGKDRAVGNAFVPFKGCSNFPVMGVGKEDMDELPVAGLSLCTPGIKYSGEGINPIGYISKSSFKKSGDSAGTIIQTNVKLALQQAGRKQRRCWSPELHRKFINALEHLGGPQAATPKQIREHMQVDGLTNDEVKSHLQKYRLHMRRMATNSTNLPISLWRSQEQHGESLRQRKTQSGSPEGPLHLSESHDGFECDAMDDEDDDKSESSC